MKMFFTNKSEIREGQCVKIVSRAKYGIKSADTAGKKPTRAGSLFQRLTFCGLNESSHVNLSFPHNYIGVVQFVNPIFTFEE